MSWFVQLNLSFDRWSGGVHIYVFPFGVRGYKCFTVVYDFSDLGLEGFSRVGV